MTKPLKNIIEEFFKGTSFKDVNILISVEKKWKKTVGDLIYKNKKIKQFKRGCLVVKTKDPVWRNELFFQKKEILKKLNMNNENIKIKEIKLI